MGKIVVSEFISLDGVIEAPETWHFPYISDDMQADINEQIHTAEAGLFGRITYSGFAEFWPTQTNNEFGIADKLNSYAKYVVSTTLDKADWNNSTLIRTMDDVAKVKQNINGNIGVTGSVVLARSLIQANLLDELRLYIHPIVVGTGQRLFEGGMDMTKLKLAESRAFAGGVILAVYHPDTSA